MPRRGDATMAGTGDRAGPTPGRAGAWAEAAAEGLRGREQQQAEVMPQAGAWPGVSSPATAPGAACHHSHRATGQDTCTDSICGPPASWTRSVQADAGSTLW